MVTDAELVKALGLLDQLAQVKASKHVWIIYLSVLKFSLELEENHFFLLSTIFGSDWNRSYKHCSFFSRLFTVLLSACLLIHLILMINEIVVLWPFV